MAEATSNVEFAHKIQEQGQHHPSPAGRQREWIEIIEAVVLAIVAVATAWSGYQASRWDALSAQHYSLASRTTVVSQAKAAMAGQDRLYDIATFDSWVAARIAGKDRLAAFYLRRFRPENATAFSAWMKLDPVNNPAAPPGPTFMAEYTNEHSRESVRLAKDANDEFEKGREHAGDRRQVRQGHRLDGHGAATNCTKPALQELWAAGGGSGGGVRAARHEHILDLEFPTSIVPRLFIGDGP